MVPKPKWLLVFTKAGINDEREWMQLKEARDGVHRGHRDAHDLVKVMPIVEIQGFDLKQVGREPHHQLMMMMFGLPGGCIKEVT
jgi:hypothetical protein